MPIAMQYCESCRVQHRLPHALWGVRAECDFCGVGGAIHCLSTKELRHYKELLAERGITLHERLMVIDGDKPADVA